MKTIKLFLNIAVIGDQRVGKTTFANSHPRIDGKGTCVFYMYKNTPVYFNFVEVNEPENIPNDVDGIIAMFALNDFSSYQNIFRRWWRNIPQNIPFVICGNKSSIKYKTVYKRDLELFRSYRMRYIQISSLKSKNISLPLIYLFACKNDLNEKTIKFD